MARVVSEQHYAARRTDILDAAERLVYSKGYEQMTIQDVLDALQISKGAFYHYFDSKRAVLEALIERMQQQAEEFLLPIVNDPDLRAIAKLQRFFAATGHWKTARKDYLLGLLRTWYADENIIVREKAGARLMKRSTPLLAAIIRQGVREGTLTTQHPDDAGQVTMALLRSFGDTLAEAILAPDPGRSQPQRYQRIAAAYADALERVLGAPAGSLVIIDAAMLEAWMSTEMQP